MKRTNVVLILVLLVSCLILVQEITMISVLYLNFKIYPFSLLKSSQQVYTDRSGLLECVRYFSEMPHIPCHPGSFRRRVRRESLIFESVLCPFSFFFQPGNIFPTIQMRINTFVNICGYFYAYYALFNYHYFCLLYNIGIMQI